MKITPITLPSPSEPLTCGVSLAIKVGPIVLDRSIFPYAMSEEEIKVETERLAKKWGIKVTV
jgi:hypothetical protein